MTPEEQKLFELWHPEAARAFARIESGKTRFVHYTTAAAAMSILRNREIWLRGASCMNDYSEVQHGIDCLVKAYRSPVGQELKQRIDEWFPGLSKEVEALFNGWQPELLFGTYISCFSEHKDDEDVLGRLSMWRAYARNVGVAFVFKAWINVVETDALNAWTSPVAYLTEDQFAARFKEFTEGIIAAAPTLQALKREDFKGRLFFSFMFAAICTKHLGFKEEREWRIVHVPKVYGSDLIKGSVEMIGVVPQLVYKIPLKNISEAGLIGVEIPELLDHIIIGPTDFPIAVRDALAELLAHTGVENAKSKIVLSGIPLRN